MVCIPVVRNRLQDTGRGYSSEQQITWIQQSQVYFHCHGRKYFCEYCKPESFGLRKRVCQPKELRKLLLPKIQQQEQLKSFSAPSSLFSGQRGIYEPLQMDSRRVYCNNSLTITASPFSEAGRLFP